MEKTKEHKSWCNVYNDIPPFKCSCSPQKDPHIEEILEEYRKEDFTGYRADLKFEDFFAEKLSSYAYLKVSEERERCLEIVEKYFPNLEDRNAIFLKEVYKMFLAIKGDNQ